MQAVHALLTVAQGGFQAGCNQVGQQGDLFRCFGRPVVKRLPRTDEYVAACRIVFMYADGTVAGRRCQVRMGRRTAGDGGEVLFQHRLDAFGLLAADQIVVGSGGPQTLPLPQKFVCGR